jgi:hypothetical protein
MMPGQTWGGSHCAPFALAREYLTVRQPTYLSCTLRPLVFLRACLFERHLNPQALLGVGPVGHADADVQERGRSRAFTSATVESTHYSVLRNEMMPAHHYVLGNEGLPHNITKPYPRPERKFIVSTLFQQVADQSVHVLFQGT